MPRKKIREYNAKRIIIDNMPALQPYNAVLVTSETDLDELPQMAERLTVKPDQLFGKRKKQGLVLQMGVY
jgi:succinyl-CoA synthetase beta subunit